MLTINLLGRKEAPPPVPGKNPGMAKRKALSKRTRFEIFKRDGFKCFYCGATPAKGATMEVGELVLDHVRPVKEGGETAAHNLVTACIPCNAGKSAVPLESRKYEPTTADVQKEHAEQLRAFLDIQRELADLRETHLEGLEEDWDRLTGLHRPRHLRGHLRGLAKEYSIDQMRSAMEKIATARLSGPALPYFRGILRNLDKPYARPEPPPAPTPAPPRRNRTQRVYEEFHAAGTEIRNLRSRREMPFLERRNMLLSRLAALIGPPYLELCWALEAPERIGWFRLGEFAITFTQDPGGGDKYELTIEEEEIGAPSDHAWRWLQGHIVALGEAAGKPGFDHAAALAGLARANEELTAWVINYEADKCSGDD